MSSNDDSYSARSKAIAIAPKFTSLLSMIGSSFIIFHVSYDIATTAKRQRSTSSNKKRGVSTYHRLLLGMSCCDLIVSTCFLLGTLPIPAGTPGVFLAYGNQNTCEAQGFFSQFSIAVAMYNMGLSVYYLVKIKFGSCINSSSSSRRRHQQRYTDAYISKYIEPVLHAFALLFGFGTATAGTILKLYNNDAWECWISPLPLDCEESWNHGGKTNCTRGNNASLYRWVLYYGPLWAAIATVTVNMYLVYRAVRNMELSKQKYGTFNAQNKRSKKVANQGFWYCGAFYLTWLFPSITRLTQVITGGAPFPLVLITAMFVPIQGFCNAIVYIHPRYKSLRSSNTANSRSTITSTVVRSSLPDGSGSSSVWQRLAVIRPWGSRSSPRNSEVTPTQQAHNNNMVLITDQGKTIEEDVATAAALPVLPMEEPSSDDDGDEDGEDDIECSKKNTEGSNKTCSLEDEDGKEDMGGVKKQLVVLGSQATT